MAWLDFGMRDLGVNLGDVPGFEGGGYDVSGGYDFSAPEAFDWGQIDPGYGAYDFGATDWNLPQPEQNFFGEGGYTYNTTTNQIEGPGGQPFGDQDIAAIRDRGLAWQGGEQPFTGAPAPGVFDQTNQFLGTNVGRAAGSLGLGLLGLGAQRLFAGGTPEYQPPTYGVSPVTAAGQQAVMNAMQGGAGPALSRALTYGTAGQADIAQQLTGRVGREAAAEVTQAPYEEAIRMAALGQVPGLMQPTGEQAINDPIQAALREELMGVLSGGSTGGSPATARRQSLEEQETRTRLYRQLGPDYELTTPGQQALREMKERHTSETFTERQATIARLSPLEQSRMQFSATAPTQVAQGRENIRRPALGDVTNLSQFGIRGAPQNATTLSQIAPVQTLLGGDPERANLINTNLIAQGGMAAYNAANQRQQQLAQGIGGVFGTVAGTVGSRPSKLEDYYGRILGSAS